MKHEDGMRQLTDMINNISDDATLTGAQAKELINIVKEYCEIEIESKKNLVRFQNSINNYLLNKS